MRRRIALPILLLAALATTPLVSTASAQTPTTADVTLRVAPQGFVVPSHHLAGNPAVWIVDPVETTALNDQDGIAGCELTVPDTTGDGRVNGVEVLDRATETGCITGWDGIFTDLGFLILSVDGLEKNGPTQSGWPGAWWLVQTNGQAASSGVSQMTLSDGDALSFVYYTGP